MARLSSPPGSTTSIHQSRSGLFFVLRIFLVGFCLLPSPRVNELVLDGLRQLLGSRIAVRSLMMRVGNLLHHLNSRGKWREPSLFELREFSSDLDRTQSTSLHRAIARTRYTVLLRSVQLQLRRERRNLVRPYARNP